jgi:type IV pilus assembly protein PilQ
MNKTTLAKLIENTMTNQIKNTIISFAALSFLLAPEFVLANEQTTQETVVSNTNSNSAPQQTTQTENNNTNQNSVDATVSNAPVSVAAPISTTPNSTVNSTTNESTTVKTITETPVKSSTTDLSTQTTETKPQDINIIANKEESKLSNKNEKADLLHINIKAQNNVTKLTLDFSKSGVKPQISQNATTLSIELPDTVIPEELQKTISTLTLDTIVQQIDVSTQKNNGKIVLFQNDSWGYSITETDKQIIVEINPIVKVQNKDAYTGQQLTLNFQNMDIRAIIQVIADFTGLNIITSDTVTGTMSVRLKDVPWDQALDLVLESKNLQKQKNGNVIWIATKQELLDKNKAQLELNEQTADLAPLKLEFFQINHYKAREMKDIIEGKYAASTAGAGGAGGSSNSKANPSLLSKRGSVGLDIRNNTIFVQDTEQKLEQIKQVIKRLDIATKQVLIEAKLVIVTDDFELDMGSRFGLALRGRSGNTQVGVSNNATDATSIATSAANNTALTGSTWNQPLQNPGGSIGFTILNSATGLLVNAELDSLETTQKGKVISNPRLLTEDNKKAEIRQGTEIPYVTPGMLNMPATVSFKDAVLSLGVTPQISPNGRVTMDLEITKDTVGQLVNVQGGGQVPSIDTRKITTQVTINNGQTVVLGGVYEVTKADDLYKVPFFANIPWVGNLFKNSVDSRQKVELLIFITPHIIKDEDLDAINQNEQVKANEINVSNVAEKKDDFVK